MIAIQQADTEEPLPSPSFNIDGKKEEWANEHLRAQSSDGTLALYAANDQTHIYFALSSSVTTKKLQLYLDTDNNHATGYQTSRWKASGAEYLVENGVLYKYAGDNKTWVFNKVVTLDSTSYMASSSFTELKLSLEQLGIKAGDTISYGVLLDDKAALRLPQTDSLLKLQVKN